jgi:hypothetical protein
MDDQIADRATLELRPIEEAPVGEAEYGPCLLQPGSDIVGLDWVLGYWDGSGWYSYATGVKLEPRRFAYLG